MGNPKQTIHCANCGKRIAEIENANMKVQRDAQLTGMCQACADISTMDVFDEFGILVKGNVAGLSESEIKKRKAEHAEKHADRGGP